MDKHDFNRKLCSLLESQGLGPTVWGERDCITMVRSVIEGVSGKQSNFRPKGKLIKPSDKALILYARQRYGSTQKAWEHHLNREPNLTPVEVGARIKPGMIGITGVPCIVGSVEFPDSMIGVIGGDYHLWIRMPEGLARANPILALWEIDQG